MASEAWMGEDEDCRPKGLMNEQTFNKLRCVHKIWHHENSLLHSYFGSTIYQVFQDNEKIFILRIILYRQNTSYRKNKSDKTAL